MPKDFMMTILMSIVAAVIAHHINNSGFITEAIQKTGRLMKAMAIILAKLSMNLLILTFSVYQFIMYANGPEPATRIETLGMIYFSIMGFEFVKFTISDIRFLAFGRRP